MLSAHSIPKTPSAARLHFNSNLPIPQSKSTHSHYEQSLIRKMKLQFIALARNICILKVIYKDRHGELEGIIKHYFAFLFKIASDKMRFWQ